MLKASHDLTIQSVRRRSWLRWVAGGLALLICCCFAFHGWLRLRRQPADTSYEICPGVVYARRSTKSPRPLVSHTVTIDLRQAGLEFLVTPGDPSLHHPLFAANTTDFLKKHDLDLAINGDFFYPWTSNHLLDYYPHDGDPVSSQGYAASKGVVYNRRFMRSPPPILHISQKNEAHIGAPPSRPYNAISGMWLVRNGKSQITEKPGSAMVLHPRTAVGLSRDKQKLALVVLDGRQPNYSMGETLSELADRMISLGAHDAINLDGGGSSILVVRRDDGSNAILNTPIDNGIPGRERVVANHLGVRVRAAVERRQSQSPRQTDESGRVNLR